MDRQVDLILQHGWAHDAHIWRDVAAMSRQVLGDRVNIVLPDRGYLGPGRAIAAAAVDRATAVICHSFGLHLIDERLLGAAHLVVIVSGFLSIHQARAQARSKRAIDKMRHGLATSAEEEVIAFHTKCGAGKTGPDGLWQAGQATSFEQLSLLNQPLLSADLEWLNRSLFDPGKISPQARVVIVHGLSDQVIPARAAREINDAIDGSSLVEVAGAGHSLPLSHPQLCLAPFLEMYADRPQSSQSSHYTTELFVNRSGAANAVTKQ